MSYGIPHGSYRRGRTRSLSGSNEYALYCDVLCGGHPAHGHLRHQVMQSEVLVIPVFPISPVHDFTSAFLYDPDEIFRLYSRVTRGKHPGWGVAVQALLNDCLDFVHVLLQAMFLQQFNQPGTGHHVLVGIQRFVLPDIPEVCSMVIEVDGPSLLCSDVILPVSGEFRTLEHVLVPPDLVDKLFLGKAFVILFLFSLLFSLVFYFLGFPCLGFLFLLSLFAVFLLFRRFPGYRSFFPTGGFLFLGFVWPGLPLSVFFLFPELMHQFLPNLPGYFILSRLPLGMALGWSFPLIGFLFLSFWLVRIGGVFWRGNVASFLVLGFPGSAAAAGRWP